MSFYQEMNDGEKMKFRRRVMLLLGLASIFAVVLIVSYGASAWRDVKNIFTPDVKLLISVSGEGKVTAKPDIAKVTATILSEGEFLKDVAQANATKSNTLVGYLKSVAVEDKDIKTVGYYISPQYFYPPPSCLPPGPCTTSGENSRPRIVGYQIRNSFEITIRDLTKAGDILAGVVSAGANEVSGISFTIDQPDQLRADARKKAIDSAKVKAEKLAHDLGRSVGPIINFSEGGGSPIYYERSAAMEKGGGGAPSAPSVQPGENEIVVNVSITYEFK